MLVDNGIARVVPHELDGHVQLVRAAHAVPQGGHFRAALDGFCPRKDGDGLFDRVGQEGEGGDGQVGAAFARARAAALQAHVAGEHGHHGDGPRGLLAIGMALGSPALTDVAGLCAADFAREADDFVFRNPGNG